MKLLASSVVRGNHADAGSGGLYLVDIESQSVTQPIDLGNTKLQWSNDGRESGLRGLAFDGETLFCVASDELFAFNSAFELQARWKNPYLKYCRGIAVFERKLFIVSSGFDSVLGFDLDEKTFDWALQIKSRGAGIGAHPYDPNGDDGPLMVPKLDLRDVFCDGSGMYITSKPGLLRFTGKEINMAVELPDETHDARPFRNGVLFNDSLSGKLRYAGRGEGEEDRSLEVALLDEDDVLHRERCEDALALAAYARGLCVVDGAIVAAGSSPAAISVYDLAANERLLSVQLSKDATTSIHSIVVWPFDE